MTTLTSSWQEITRGSFNTGYGVFSVILIACCSEDVSGNYSTVSTIAEWELTNGSISFDNWHVGLDTTGTSGGHTDLGACSPQGLVQSSWTVAHNEDGTGTASVGISWNCSFGLTSWSDRQTVDLPTIPRKSNVSLSASSVVLDGHSSVIIYTNRKSSSFSHTLKYSVVPSGSPFITFASDVGDSYTWVPPTNWYDVIVNGSNTYTIRCETYSGGTYIGSTDVGLTITSAGISQASLSTPSITLDGSNRVVIYTNKRCDTFTHTIQQNFSDNFENIGTGVVDSVSWTPTSDYYNTIGGGSKTFTIRCYTYNGGTEIGYVDNSFTINSIGADDVSAPDMTMGSEYTVSISKRLSSFRHTLIWSFGGASGSIGSDKGVDTSAPWTPSPSLAEQIKTSMSAQAVITCETFYGNKSIGTKQTHPTIYVPAYDIVLDTPKITEEGTCRDTDKTALTAKGVGANEVMALLSVKRLVVNATTSHYASITNISVSFGGTTKSVSSGSFNDTFSDMMNSELSISVTDSRNKVYSKSYTNNTYKNYFLPTVLSFDGTRDTQQSSTGTLNANGSFWHATAGTTANALTASIIGAASGNPTLTYQQDNANQWLTSFPISGVDATKSYNFTITVTDSFGNKASKNFTLPISVPIMWKGKRTVRIHNFLIVDRIIKAAKGVFTESVTAPTFNGALSGNATTATDATTARYSPFLREHDGAGSTRLTSSNIIPTDTNEYGGMRKDTATSSMTEGKPSTDANLLTMFWDNSGRWDTQIAQSNVTGSLEVRSKNGDNNTWSSWSKILDSSNFVNYIYPVGSIYLQVGTTTSPASLFGGSWANLDSGWRMLLAGPQSSGNGWTGGSLYTHDTAITSDQSGLRGHSHGAGTSGFMAWTNPNGDKSWNGEGNNYSIYSRTADEGGWDAAAGHHHDLDWQPFITITAWKRVG